MSRVVVAKWSGYTGRPRLGSAEFRRLVETALNQLLPDHSALQCLTKLLPRGPIGFKTNCLTGRLNSTPVHLCDAIADLLVSAGWDQNDIVIWERTSRELSDAGYELNVSGRGRRCLGTDAAGLGYSREFYSSNDVNSLVSRVLIDTVESNINLSVLKDHSIAGLSGSLKNMYGAIHNPNKFHDNNCNPFCADINNLKPIREKNRLTITCAEQVQYNGGPGYLAGFMSAYGGLILSTDPVAADRIGLEIVESLRSKHSMPSLTQEERPANYIDTAGTMGLGQPDMTQVELIVLNVDENNATIGELI